MIASHGNNGRKKEYLITESGKKISAGELNRLAEILNLAEKIMEEECTHE